MKKDQSAERKHSQWGDIWLRLQRNRLAMVGLAIVVIIVLSAVFADVIAPYAYDKQDLANRFAYPSMAHLFGTDQYGRDIFTRVLYGGRTSLLVSLMATLIALLVAIIIGACAGFYGKKVDTLIMRVMDVLQAIPAILMAVCISTLLGTGTWQTGLAIAVSSIAPGTRLIRGTTLTIRDQEYIEAARACGSGDLRTILTHVVPNCLSPIIVDCTLRLGGNILMISSLSFIGLGVQPPIAEWGSILNSGREFIRSFWPIITFPGIAIMLTMFGFNVLGDGLRDALDPHMKQ